MKTTFQIFAAVLMCFYAGPTSAGLEDIFFPIIANHINLKFVGSTWTLEGGESGVRNVIDRQNQRMTHIGAWGPVESLSIRLTEFTYPEMQFAGVFEINGIKREVRGAWRCDSWGGSTDYLGGRVNHYEVELLCEFQLDMFRMQNDYSIERHNDRRVLLRLKYDLENLPVFPWHTRPALVLHEKNGGRIWMLPLTVAQKQLMPYWTPGNHLLFPDSFRRAVFELLLIRSTRPEGLMSPLPKDVLFMIIERLAEM